MCLEQQAKRLVGNALCRELGKDKQWMTKWACENVKGKQTWIKKVFDPPVIFEDVCTAVDEPELTPVHVVVAGWSCKSLSKLNTEHQKGHNTEALRKGEGPSAKTLQGLTQVLKKLNVPIYLGENVEDLADPWSDNRAAFLEVVI